MNETKICPYCGEEIKASAIKCRYCHTMLEESPKNEESLGTAFQKTDNEKIETKQEKKQIWKKWWVWACVGAVAIVIVVFYVTSENMGLMDHGQPVDPVTDSPGMSGPADEPVTDISGMVEAHSYKHSIDSMFEAWYMYYNQLNRGRELSAAELEARYQDSIKQAEEFFELGLLDEEEYKTWLEHSEKRRTEQDPETDLRIAHIFRTNINIVLDIKVPEQHQESHLILLKIIDHKLEAVEAIENGYYDAADVQFELADNYYLEWFRMFVDEKHEM